MGEVVITLVLQKYGKLPSMEHLSRPPVLVTVFDEASQLSAIELTTELRTHAISAACYPQVIGLGKQFKYASRIGSWVAVVIGPDEIQNKQVTIKNLKTHEQQTVQRDLFVQTVKNILAEPSSL